MTDYTTPSSSLADTVATGGSKIEESIVANVRQSQTLKFITLLLLFLLSRPFFLILSCLSNLLCVCVTFHCVQVALPPSLPLPRREALQQSSGLSTVSPATVDLTLKVTFLCFNKKHEFILILHIGFLAETLG